MSSHALDARIWDVEHGSAAFIRAGSKNVVLDCGTNSDFSPIRWISGPKYGINTLHYLIISHPHQDHIEDLDNVDEYDLKPNIVNRPKKATPLVEEQLKEAREEGDDEYVEDAEYYLNVLDEYSGDPDPPPSDPAWVNESDDSNWALRSDGGDRGVTFHNYSTRDNTLGSDNFEKLNNLSKVTLINSFGFKFVSTGDLLPEGIDEIMENSAAMSDIEDAHVLIAPHHGRDSSYVDEFVDHINPDLVVFSDKGGVENTATEEYRSHAAGYPVLDEESGETDTRYVLTTRNDGRIRIQASNEQTWEVSISGQEYAEAKAQTRRYTNIGREY